MPLRRKEKREAGILSPSQRSLFCFLMRKRLGQVQLYVHVINDYQEHQLTSMVKICPIQGTLPVISYELCMNFDVPKP